MASQRVFIIAVHSEGALPAAPSLKAIYHRYALSISGCSQTPWNKAREWALSCRQPRCGLKDDGYRRELAVHLEQRHTLHIAEGLV